MSVVSKILIIEDDPALNRQMKELMVGAGYQVESCFNGDSGLIAAMQECFQLILLDVMLPMHNGMTLLAMLRKTSQVPVIVVSAKGAEQERIMCLREGADDYVSKPFNPTELVLRVGILLRRAQPQFVHHHSQVMIDSLVLDSVSQTACIGGNDIHLTSTQFKLLWELGTQKGTMLTKAYLSRQVLNKALGTYDRSLDMHLSRVRRKLNEGGWQGTRLQTVHGAGYRLT
ncbi:response regulator transcription factor [Marinagarivorans algicola]|uniref:response regulator transcription factor n=1 Tax=Marinagarivorans algicola TaxID=1513270 RepID=UPI003736F1D0